MTKFLFTLFFCLFFMQCSFAQTSAVDLEKAITDSVCNCLATVKTNEIANKQEAMTAFGNCFGKHTDLLLKLAEAKGIDISDKVAMRGVGSDIGKDLLAQNCAAFMSIAVKMADDGNDKEGDMEKGKTEGTLKRVDLKGFEYFVVTDGKNNEKSFIWMRQFPGSEKFMNGTTQFFGKKIKISWQEIEVYLPVAKGYFKLKEITAIEL